MNKAVLNSMSKAERRLVSETEREALVELDEDALLELHSRVRRARTKYVKNYRRAASTRVVESGSRGAAYRKNELALARVSRHVEVMANRAAAELRAERLQAARAATATPGLAGAGRGADAVEEKAPVRSRAIKTTGGLCTTEDYQAAEQLLRRPALPGELVIGDKIQPQWMDDGARFWYAVSNGAGKRFVLVDAAAGTREPAFDHARLAVALAAVSRQTLDPEALPFIAIQLGGNAVEFDAFGEYRRCRLDNYACERAEFTPPGNPLDVPSPDRKVAVSRRAHDLWARSLSDGREWALTSDGEPDYRYGPGPDSTSNGTLLRKFGLPYLPPAVAWSPDSTKVLTHRTDERDVRQAHLVEARPADGSAPLVRTRRYAYPGDEQVPNAELVVLDVAEGTVIRAQAKPLLMPQFSPIMMRSAWWAEDSSATGPRPSPSTPHCSASCLPERGTADEELVAHDLPSSSKEHEVEPTSPLYM